MGPQDSLIIWTDDYEYKSCLIEREHTESLIIELQKKSERQLAVEDSLLAVKNSRLANSQLDTARQGRLQATHGREYAFWVRNETPSTAAEIRSVSFYVGRSGLPKGDFHFRLYRTGANGSAPIENPLVEKDVFMMRKHVNEWYTIDIKENNTVDVPKEGFFVSIEFMWLEYHYGTEMLGQAAHKKAPLGTQWSPDFAVGTTSMWTRTTATWHRRTAGDWILLPLKPEVMRTYSALIKVGVSTRK